jgi:hypothetical protein
MDFMDLVRLCEKRSNVFGCVHCAPSVGKEGNHAKQGPMSLPCSLISGSHAYPKRSFDTHEVIRKKNWGAL